MVNWLKDNDLSLLNTQDQRHTHFDCTNNSESNILDLAIIDNKDLVSEFRIDADKTATPYRIRIIKGKRQITLA